jgi:hypothetical protein
MDLGTDIIMEHAGPTIRQHAFGGQARQDRVKLSEEREGRGGLLKSSSWKTSR